MRLKALTDNETMTYLNYLVTGKWIKFELPEITYTDLKYHVTEEYISGLEPKVGSMNIRIIAIDNYFPDESFPLMLERLNHLGFEFRWNTRFFFLTKLEAQKNINILSDMYEQDIIGLKGAVANKTAFASRKYNRGAEYLFEEAENAKANSMISNINYGKYGCNIVLYNENEQLINEQKSIVLSLLQEMGYKAREERINSQEAFLSTIDGEVYKNKRRSLISTENLADLLPLSGFWHGLDYHPSQLYPEQSSPMFMVDCNSYQSFKGNLFVHDVGHSLIIGKSGAGKSTLVNFIIASHMRYTNAQFFGLDNKHSMMPLCYGVNGEHYDLGYDDTSFQPLADIDTTSGYDFAVDWIEALCIINNVNINVEISRAIQQSLSVLSVVDTTYRTMENLLTHAKSANEELAHVISLYVGSDTLQAKVIGADVDRIKWSNYNVFELSEFITKGEKALIPTLKYIFYKIMQRLDGRPTLIVIEEAWMAFNSPIFAKQLDEWLKTLRKLNVYIVMVALQVQEIVESPIKNTLLNQCASIIYTPNPDLKKTEVYNAYKEFGLTDKQVSIIQNAQMKREYYLTNGDGDRLFNLDMNYFEVGKAFFTSTSKDDIKLAKSIKLKHTENFAQAWLKEQGINDIEI
jgi:type IV secretion/conjugal transfer VirB4 family ATPase